MKESTLGRVPSAAQATNAASAANATNAGTAANAGLLDNLDSTAFPRTRSVSDADFSSPPLELEVAGFGTYQVWCDSNTASFTDDELFFGQASSISTNGIQSGYLSTAPFPGEPASAFQIRGATPSAAGTSVFQDERMSTVISDSIPGTQRSIIVFLGGFDNDSTNGCSGHIQALVFG